MDIEEKPEDKEVEMKDFKTNELNKDETKEETKKKEETTVKMEVEEPKFQILTTPARVTRRQLKYITFDIDPRYKPISEHVHGIIILKDDTPSLQEDLIEFKVPSLDVIEENEEIAEPPEAFVFNG